MQKQLSLLLLFMISLQLSAQDNVIIDQANYIANYFYTYQEDSLNSDRIRTDEMSLYIGNEYSAFEHSGKFYSDSLKRDAKKQANPDAALFNTFAKTNNKSSGSHFTYYIIIKKHNSQKNILAEYIPFSTKYIKVEEVINFNWELISNSDTIINHYNCKKATTNFKGRHYQAWYTMELPISEGPYKFRGLPGLIIKLQDSQSQHIFVLSEFKKTSNSKPIYFDENKYQSTSMKAYYTAKKADLLNLTRAFSGEGKIKIKIETTADIGEITSKILSKNNFIERL